MDKYVESHKEDIISDLETAKIEYIKTINHINKLNDKRKILSYLNISSMDFGLCYYLDETTYYDYYAIIALLMDEIHNPNYHLTRNQPRHKTTKEDIIKALEYRVELIDDLLNYLNKYETK